ncbi:peptidoglycan DD-metalloendopeptidase family protein [Streptomyces sp. NPDC059766]|uniref:peptidoglycan DD-metalloendopeptidase family protein n=1 Tax=Streptomyces sp. NPDC059766 TaxID=3346940 RepID=UPI003655879F
MRRDHSRRLLSRAGVALAALLFAFLPSAAYADGLVPVHDDSRPDGPVESRPRSAFDRLLDSAARQTAAYEKARARTDRLRDRVTRLRTETNEAEARAHALSREADAASGKAPDTETGSGTGPDTETGSRRGPDTEIDSRTDPETDIGGDMGGLPLGDLGVGFPAAVPTDVPTAFPTGRPGAVPTAVPTDVPTTASAAVPGAVADARALRAALGRAVTRLHAAERRRAGIRSRLWRELAAAQPGLGRPAADCAPGRRSRRPHHASSRWVTPTSDYRLSAGYAAPGGRWRHRHTGQDFAVPTGTPVHAVGPGTVVLVSCGDGFGNQVVVRHRDGYFTQYAHLSRIDVRPGQRVAAGQYLAASGATGNATGPHLHFEVRVTPYLGSAVPPLPWLRRHGVRL